MHSAYPPSSTLYADLREKWKHEDELIHQRVTWLLTSQSFLFTSLGVLTKLRLDSEQGKPEFWHYNVGAALVIVCALVVTRFLRDGIFAAVDAMHAIKSQLKSHRDAGRIWSEIGVDVLDETTREGIKPARGMVNTFATIWCFFYLYEVFRMASLFVSEYSMLLIALAIAASGVLCYRYGHDKLASEQDA